MNLPFRTEIQIADATFGTQPTAWQPISFWFEVPTPSYLPSLVAAPTFDDQNTYVDDTWRPWLDDSLYGIYLRYAISSVRTPACGVQIHVTDTYLDAGQVTVDFTWSSGTCTK